SRTELHLTPHHVPLDNLFDSNKLDEVNRVFQQDSCAQQQKHTYSALYVDNAKCQKTRKKNRFVQRILWQLLASVAARNIAVEFLAFLRGDEFMSLLSRMFKVQLTDINVANPAINSNYFRLGATDFVNQHADGSPGREVCMLLYLNKDWHNNGGELVFI